MENAPFYSGQEVVCIKTHSRGVIKKGQVFTIKKVKKGCCLWLVDIGYIPNSPLIECPYCDDIRNNYGIGWFGAKLFAPINSIKIEIPESLKEQAEELISVKETISQPEPILQ